MIVLQNISSKESVQQFVYCTLIQVIRNQLKASKADDMEKSLLYRHSWISASIYTVDYLEQDTKEPNKSLLLCRNKYEFTYNEESNFIHYELPLIFI